MLFRSQNEYCKFSASKESKKISEIQRKISCYKDISVKEGIELPNELPDIDLLLHDDDNDCICFFEVKSLLNPVSINHLKSKLEDLKKGQNQLISIKKYLESNWEEFIKRHLPSVESTKCYEKWFAIISDNFVGNANESKPFPVISFEWLQSCLSLEGNLQRSMKIITKTKVLPKIEDDLKEIEERVEFAGYTFVFHHVGVKRDSIFCPPTSKKLE